MNNCSVTKINTLFEPKKGLLLFLVVNSTWVVIRREREILTALT